MTEFGPNDAEILIYCFKDGVLAKVAHDLKLRVTRFSITADQGFGHLSAEIETDSLEVVSTMKDDKETRSLLSKRDFGKIEANVRKDVLLSKKHPKIAFESTEVSADGNDLAIKGQLTVMGKSRGLTLKALDTGDAYEAKFQLNQPSHGIKPFSAMMGTLKIKPDVRIVVRVPKS